MEQSQIFTNTESVVFKFDTKPKEVRNVEQEYKERVFDCTDDFPEEPAEIQIDTKPT